MYIHYKFTDQTCIEYTAVKIIIHILEIISSHVQTIFYNPIYVHIAKY